MEKEHEIISTELSKIIDKFGTTAEDKDYAVFLMFSTLGSCIFMDLGEEAFNKIVENIKMQTKRVMPEIERIGRQQSNPTACH